MADPVRGVVQAKPSSSSSSSMSMNTAVEESQINSKERRAAGEFVRGVSTCRHTIQDGGEFPPEPCRYALLIAFNCPWSHRVALARSMLGLQDSISLDVCFPNRTGADDPVNEGLWQFAPDKIATATGKPLPECTEETVTGKKLRLIKEVYAHAGVTDQTSVPILYDKKAQRVVSNESAEIVRMLNENRKKLRGDSVRDKEEAAYFDSLDLYPEQGELRQQIDELNNFTYNAINNGAYKAGFSSSQEIYERAFAAYFAALDSLEQRLAASQKAGPFLFGANVTEADLRLFPTLFRHDAIYYTRMKLNGAFLWQYPLLWRWVCAMWQQVKGVQDASPLVHSMQGYFGRTGTYTIPLGPLKPMRYPEAFNHPELAVAATK